MHFFRYRAKPADKHPERDVLGEAYVCCWINKKDLDVAEKLARRNLKQEKWELIEREVAQVVTEADYEGDDEWLAYYQQALTDTEVYVFHLSPRYSVYWVVVAIEKGSPPEAAEAHYFLAGEAISDESEEVAVPGFWEGERREVAVKAAREVIVEAGWTIKEIVSEQPCGPDDLPPDMVTYFDEAEEQGSCLVFIHDDEKGDVE